MRNRHAPRELVVCAPCHDRPGRLPLAWGAETTWPTQNLGRSPTRQRRRPPGNARRARRRPRLPRRQPAPSARPRRSRRCTASRPPAGDWPESSRKELSRRRSTPSRAERMAATQTAVKAHQLAGPPTCAPPPPPPGDFHLLSSPASSRSADHRAGPARLERSRARGGDGLAQRGRPLGRCARAAGNDAVHAEENVWRSGERPNPGVSEPTFRLKIFGVVQGVGYRWSMVQ